MDGDDTLVAPSTMDHGNMCLNAFDDPSTISPAPFCSPSMLMSPFPGFLPSDSSKITDEKTQLIQRLEERVSKLEDDNRMFKERLEGIEIKFPVKLKKTRAKALSIEIPSSGRETGAPYMLPTPALSAVPFSFSTVPETPATPVGFIVPSTPQTPINPSARRRSQTFLNKSPAHDLNQKLPPSTVQLPLVPLTDRELIVFFFNSTSRPIVAIRIYGRQWGPKEISDVVNDHRVVLPAGYQRNTCSVKFNTAIRRGEEEAGEGEEEESKPWLLRMQTFFRTANDFDATDAIRLTGDEAEAALDYSVLSMTNGLKKYPVEDNGENGLFTKSLRWCCENEVNIQLSEIHRVALAFQNGLHPSTAIEPRHDWGTMKGRIN